MPRKPKPIPHDPSADVNVTALADAAAARDENEARAAAVAEMLGADEPYNLERSVQICLAMRDITSRALLELGRQLLLIKEHEPHGEFRSIVEQRLQLSYNTARRSMQAAAKFMDGTARRKLANELSQTKLLELMAEDDEELDALAEGGTLAGLDLDEVERMSTRELRAALKSERSERDEEKGATDKLLAEKNRKIDDLSKKLNARKAEGWPAEINEYLESVVTLCGQACESIVYAGQEAERLAMLELDESTAAEEARILASRVVLRNLELVQSTLINIADSASSQHPVGMDAFRPTSKVGEQLAQRWQNALLALVDDTEFPALGE